MMERLATGWRKAALWTAAGVTAVLLGGVAAYEAGALDGVALWGAGRALGYEISCGRVEGGLLGRFTCTDLTLADAKGRFLTAQRLTLAWDPWALLHNEAALETVDLTGAALSRLPESQSTSASSDFLPGIKISIGVLQLRTFTLALRDAPKACINLGARGAIGPAGFDAALAVARCSPERGRLDFTGRYDKPSGALALSASGHDDGAIAAALTGIETAGTTTVSLKGTGTVSSFNGTIAIKAEHVGAVGADFRARDLTATSLDARFDLVPALLPRWAPQGSGTVSADVTRGPNGGFDVSALALDWAGVRGSGQLSLSAEGRLDGALHLSTSRAFVIAGGRIGGLDAHATISGTKAQPALSGAMTLSDVSAASLSMATLRANFAVTPAADNAMAANVVGNAQGASLPSPADGLLGTAFSFKADATRAADGAIVAKATVNGTAAQLAAEANLGAQSGHGTLTLTVPDLAKADAGFAGRVTARLALGTLTLAGDLDGTLNADGAAIAPGGAGAALGASPSLSAHLHGRGGSYRISDLRIETAAAAVQGSASLVANGALSAHLETMRGNLAPLSAVLGRTLKGDFTLKLDLSGTQTNPRLAVAARIPRMRVDNVIAKDTAFDLDAQKTSAWSGAVTLKSSTPAGAVDLAARVDAADGGWRADIAKGALGPATLSGHLAAGDNTYSGALTLKGDLLAPVGFALDTPMHGSGTLALKGDGQNLGLAVDLKQVAAGPLKDATVQVNATAKGFGGPLEASLAVKDGTNHVAAAAHGTLAPLAITATKFDGRWAGAEFALSAPTTFRSSAGRFTLDRTAIAIGGGSLILAADGDANSLNASAHLAGMPVAPLATMLQIGKGEGTIGLDFTTTLARDRTQADFHLRANDLMFNGTGRKEKPANVDLKAQWNGAVAQVDGRISGLDSKDATLTATVPMVRSRGSYLPKLAQSGAVSAQLRAQMQAARLMALLPIAEENATGLLTASADVTGDIAAPQISGKVALADGSFTDYQTGTKLEKLNAAIDATGGSRATLTLTATDGNSGTIKANGEFSVAALEAGGAGHVAGHLDVTLDDAEIVREDLAHGSATGTLALDLPGDQPPAITGKLRTGTVRVDVGAAIPPAIPEIDVIEINGGPGTRQKPKPKPSLFSKASLDISVTMPNRVYVAGHGIDSEWSGNLDVGGTLAAPDVSGQLELVRGQAELIGKTFTLQEGKVALANSIPGNASVHIVGQNESSDITATITIEGPVAEPKISWSSSPALPQSEILSRLFFGTSTPHLTIGQAFQLAQLSGQLGSLGSLGGGSGGILGFARNMIGLDVLRVETPSDLKGTGASVTAGKYVTDKVYVGVKQGTDVSAGTAQVEVKITPHITLDAEAGANSQTSAGVTWKWDY